MHHRSPRPVRSYPSSGSHRSSRARRSGQALLLAVLLMVFAALIGSTFITVVALNMDQTATQEQRQAAAGAANAGLQVANYQINANGTSWRPEQVSPPPAPGDPDYNFYWSAQDIAQGYARTTPHATNTDSVPYTGRSDGDWDNNGVFDALLDDAAKLDYEKSLGKPGYVKFPDPRLEQTLGSHIYMTEVRQATTTDGTDKTGMLKITSVGLSSDDPNVYVKNTGYKGTETKGGAFAWGLFHTNWNYKKNKTTTTELASGAALPAGQTSIVVNDATGITPGRILVLQQGSNYEFVMCSAVSGNTITLKGATTVAYNAASVSGPVSVRAATTLMNDLVGADGSFESPPILRQFDADGDGSTSLWERTIPQVRTTNFGYHFNTDVLLQAKSNLILNPGQEMSAAGLIQALGGKTRARVLSTDDGLTERLLPVSYDPTPANVIGTATTAPQARVKDNPDPNNDSFDATNNQRTVKTQVPPDLTKFTKLLDLTKYAPGGPIGLGPGVYINNGEDVEKVLDGGSLRPLSISDLQRFWQGKTFPSLSGTDGNADLNPGANTAVPAGTTHFRLAYRHLAPPADGYTYPLTNGSLEQRGIRGWVSSFEFVPRGAQVELNGDTITITLDDLSDTTPDLPDPNKAWPWAVDTTIAPTPLPKAYRMTINTLTNARTVGGPGTTRTVSATATEPFNGVIFAEGNIRVRGNSGSRPITIVSMNNIYIEGNLRQGSTTGRIALMARKNVVLNPTQFITRVDGSQDRVVATRAFATYPITTVNGTGMSSDPLVVTSTDPAGNTAALRIGDWVRVGTNSTWSRIEDIVFGNALVLNPPLASTTTAGDKLRLLCDPEFVRGNDTTKFAASINTVTTAGSRTVGDVFRTTEHFYRLGGAVIGPNSLSDTFVRDMKMDNVPTVAGAGSGGSYILAARMVGERREAFSLQFKGTASGGGPTTIAQAYYISNREDQNNDSTWGITEDLFRATASSGTSYPFSHDLRNFTSSGSPSDTTETIAALKTTFNSANSGKWQLNNPTPSGTTNLTLGVGASSDGATAARYLARVGHTYEADTVAGDDITAAATTTTDDEVAKFTLTTSVGLNWQSNLQTIFGTGAAVIGSNPASLMSNPDDVETTRSDFYWYNNSNSTNRDAQQWLRWIRRTVSLPGTGNNIVALQRDPLTDAVLPPLRIGALKLERDDFIAAGARAYSPVEVNIQATIFAQEGSWFVIPMPQQHRSDEDSNGSTNLRELALATRMNRMNYRITVTGAMVQNYAPSGLEDFDQEHSPDDQRVGAMARWIDAYSYPTELEPDGISSPNGPNPRGRNWMTIQYNTAGILPVNSGLWLPPSPDVSTTS